MLQINNPDPNSVIFDTLNELFGLASPKINMWQADGKPEAPVFLRFFFRQPENFHIYHHWLKDAVAAFSGHLLWGIWYLAPSDKWDEKLFLAPKMFTDHWEQSGQSSHESIRDFFGQEGFDWINTEAQKDTVALAAHIRTRFNSQPPRPKAPDTM